MAVWKDHPGQGPPECLPRPHVHPLLHANAAPAAGKYRVAPDADAMRGVGAAVSRQRERERVGRPASRRSCLMTQRENREKRDDWCRMAFGFGIPAAGCMQGRSPPETRGGCLCVVRQALPGRASSAGMVPPTRPCAAPANGCRP